MFFFIKILKGLSFLGLGGVVMLAGGYAYLASFTGSPAADYELFAKENSRPLVIAHRGGRGIAPENTLVAFQKSADLGVDVLELDIHATKDGELVAIHDRSVDRTTNGKGRIEDMTFDEVRKLDAGYKWSKDDGKTFPFRGKEIRIPRLKEVFEAFPEAVINVESKHSSPSPVNRLCSYIKEFKRSNRTIFASFHKEVLQDFRQNCPQVATSASPSESTWFLSMYKVGLGENYKAEMQALQIPQRIFGSEIVTAEFLRAARGQNLEVHVWTINKREDMKRLVEIGVDGIMTDYPDRLLEILKKR